ncbi:MAG: DnaD domain protein [Bacillota bacterium]|nr:DnaD domain protein [Bacillota bacterium]
MATGLFLPGNILSLHRKAADRLLAADNGDAALLYLCLLAGKDGASLKWEAPRLEAAHKALITMKLADPDQPVTPEPPKKLEDDRPPDYTTQDIAAALQNGGGFAGLVPEVEKLLGKVLSPADLKTLYLLTDYYALPPEVILILVGWCAEKTAKKYGPGRKPTMPQIRREGQKWYKAGVTSLDSADAYLHRQQQLGSRGMEILAILGIRDRGPVPREEEFLSAWIAMDFPDDVLRLAYERTVFQTGEFRWAYMNGILKSWDQQGLKTVAAIESGEARRKTTFHRPKAQEPSAMPSDDISRMIEEARRASQPIPGKEE